MRSSSSVRKLDKLVKLWLALGIGWVLITLIAIVAEEQFFSHICCFGSGFCFGVWFWWRNWRKFEYEEI